MRTNGSFSSSTQLLALSPPAKQKLDTAYRLTQAIMLSKMFYKGHRVLGKICNEHLSSDKHHKLGG